MRCISPILIRRNQQRNYVPCGKCNFCLQNKRADWSFRLNQELKNADTAHFLTLTYDEQTVPQNSETGLLELSKSDVQLFTKRLRKENLTYTDKPLRYYTVGEYGTQTFRPHYHSIMFNLAAPLSNNLDQLWKVPRHNAMVLAGNTHLGKVEPASIHYVTKYCINREGEYTGREKPFALMSRRPGIGSNYLNTHTNWHLDDARNYTQVNGIKARIPRFYKDKIFAYKREETFEEECARLQSRSTSVSKENMRAEALRLADEKHWKDFSDMAKFHSDPDYYLEERKRAAHDRIISKVNSQNTF